MALNSLAGKRGERLVVAKLRIVSSGNGTFVELDGKTMGRGVEYLKFEHDGQTRKPTLDLRLDLTDFRFMPDGRLDEVEKRFQEAEPPSEDAGRLA